MLNFGGTTGHILGDLSRRLASFLWVYITSYVNQNLYMIVIILSFLVAPSSMLLMLIAWKKLLKLKGTKMDKIVSMYRETQLLVWYYNDLHKLGIIPAIIVLLVAGLPVATSCIVSTWKKVDTPTAAVLGVMIVISVEIILLAFHLPLKIYATTKHLLPTPAISFARPILSLNKQDTRIMNRYWRSFPLLKIYFFESNYFENDTPLVILNFSIGCAINLILLGK